jgi:hypothetical protein
MNGFFSAHDHAGGGLAPSENLPTTWRLGLAETATATAEAVRVAEQVFGEPSLVQGPPRNIFLLTGVSRNATLVT